ncbi:hypothetical protein L1987_28885 [Smallanthus sonchifolius]|uniref:Uncharacterized protein n=1 Tax=Smallanthus sonchifolius TaxID=185202 RepID=A0ACB9HYD4_9ASTR|nr:hypothetical protein L1987_28885 [Smallanthus sonchifolius]
MTTVKILLSENPVVVFSKTTCCISHSIIELIRKFGANPMIYELPYGNRIERELQELGCSPIVPAVFIGKKLVGDANELITLNLESKLRSLLINANAIWIMIGGVPVMDRDMRITRKWKVVTGDK